MVLKKILWFFLGFIVCVVVGVGMFAALLWYRPESLINKQTLRWAQEHFLPQQKIPWESLDFSLRKISSGKYGVHLEGDDFCLDLKSYGHACFEKFHAEIVLGVGWRGLKSLEILQLEIKDKDVALIVPQEEETPRAKEASTTWDLKALQEKIQTYLEEIEKLHIGRVDLDLSHTTLTFGETRMAPKILLNQNLKFELTFGDFEIKLQADPQAASVQHASPLTRRFKLSLEVSSSVFHLNFQGEAALGKESGYSLEGEVQAAPRTKELLQYASSVRGHFKTRLDARSLTLDLRAVSAQLRQKPLNEVNVARCHTAFPLTLAPTDKLNVDCSDIRLGLDFSQMQFEKMHASLKKEIPKELSLDILGEVPGSWLASSPFSSSDPVRLRVQSKPVHKDLFHFSFRAETGFLHQDQGWTLKDPDVAADLVIPYFEKLVKRLKGTSYAVPAPFHVMKGTLEAKINELPKTSDQRIQIPFQVLSRLTSARNRVVGEVNGLFTYFFRQPEKKPSLKMDVSLDEIYVQLPPFDPVRGLPPLTLDGRIKPTLEAQKKTELPLELDVKVKTTRPDSIRIYYDLLDPYAAFGVNASLDESLHFKVSKEPSPFKINYLKRSVSVQSLQLEQTAENKALQVSGRLLYQATGYDIFIDFSGPMDQPEVVLSSDPPLDRQDIISVLLYNRVSSDIASFEQENVGGTEAALADRAVGLFGLWAFASTPIESVSYNSVTGTYSAQIKLPQGFRFSIGTNWESVQNLELRRRLTGNWFVSTIYHPETDQEEGRGEIMLQRKTSY
jgi:hypothetical protein